MHDQSIITIATDGLTFDAILFNEAYQHLGFSQAVVAEALDAAQAYKFSDDASIVACRKMPAEKSPARDMQDRVF